MLSSDCLWHQHDFLTNVISTACYLINRSPHSSINFKIPNKVWSGNPVNYCILRIFGRLAYAHVNNRKLVNRAIKCVFLGHASESKGYRLWCPDFKKVS